MIYHLGLLDDDPTQNRTYQWVRRRGWFTDSFPEDVREELAIWFAMPGFTDGYHMRNLKMGRDLVNRVRLKFPGYDELSDKVAENWLSITREDAIRLAHMRKGAQACPIPLVSQLAILDELKAGKTQAATALLFGCTPRAVYTILHKGVQWGLPLPSGFELLVANSRPILHT